jgi:peptidoglycan hydrolase-like protein with peptidoglycan-binding domain
MLNYFHIKKSSMGFAFSRADENSANEYVRAIQECLISLGYDLVTNGADGRFGMRTESAVKSFQISKSMPATGVVDVVTWNALAQECPTILSIASDDPGTPDRVEPRPFSEMLHSYVVPEEIPVIAQPTELTCWAAVLTMMKSWYDGLDYSIESCLDTIGYKYQQKFQNNQPLYGNERQQFLQDTGLRTDAPQNYTPEAILRLLESCGPIWVTTQENRPEEIPDKPFSLHARIVYGLYGDGTLSGTTVRIIDPIGGITYHENFERFMTNREDVARLDGAPLDILSIIHY